MRLLAFADLHLDAPFTWAGADLARARRRSLRDTLRRIRDLALQERVDAVLCGGDLYEHDRFSPETVAFVADMLGSLPMRVFLAPGNHDWFGPGSLYAQVHWPPHVHVFEQARLTPIDLEEGLTLWGAAHQAPVGTRGLLDDFRVDRDGLHLALFHGSEQGAMAWQEDGKSPHAPFRAEQVRAAGLTHAFVGHYHRPSDADTHTYPGNPDPLSFGEEGFRGVVVADVSADGTVRTQRHRVAVSEVHDIEVVIDGAAHAQQVREQVAAAVATLRGAVRVTITGEVAPDVDLRPGDLVDVAPHLEALVPRLGALTVAYDVDRLQEERTVRGQFVRDVLADPLLADDTRRRILVTGLRALDGRADDLEVH